MGVWTGVQMGVGVYQYIHPYTRTLARTYTIPRHKFQYYVDLFLKTTVGPILLCVGPACPFTIPEN